jgi:hypothetical protein
MATAIDNTRTVNSVEALIQLLRSRSYEEIRQRMYDNPPGSPWWSACRTELDIRNGERTATSLVDTSRVLDKMRISAERLETSSDKLQQATNDLTDLLKGTKESGRRVEIATYVMVAVTILQLFYVTFQFLGRR